MLSLVLAGIIPLGFNPVFTYGTRGAQAYCVAREQGSTHMQALRTAWEFGISRLPVSKKEESKQIWIFSKEVVMRCGQYAPDFQLNHTPIRGYEAQRYGRFRLHDGHFGTHRVS